MPRKKKLIETLVESKVETPKVATEESEAKKQFRSYMADYKVKKPAKYAIKEAEFLNHLNQL